MTPHDLPRRLLLSRRAALLGGVALLAGCATPSADRRSSEGDPGAEPRPSSGGQRPPPSPPPYRAPTGEALPRFKEVAGSFAQRLATYDAGAAKPLAGPDFTGTQQDLEAAAAPLYVQADWSRAEVEFVQYGGLTPVSPQATSGVALVVLRQVIGADGGSTILRRTLDLRLRQRAGTWQVEELASAGGSPVARPARLTALGVQVLDDRRIDLPDSARWDVHAGQVDEQLLSVMIRLAEVSPLRATVLKTGHPLNVVDGRAAPPPSAHAAGKAVDINALSGAAVGTGDPAVLRKVVEAAGALAEVAQVGAPTGLDLDAGARRFFTNLVHADHLHVAVRGATA